MSHDPTEAARREMIAEINHEPGSREALAALHGDVWDTAELQEHFSVLGFLAPFCLVERRRDGARGTVVFQHSPRFYFGFEPDRRGR